MQDHHAEDRGDRCRSAATKEGARRGVMQAIITVKTDTLEHLLKILWHTIDEINQKATHPAIHDLPFYADTNVGDGYGSAYKYFVTNTGNIKAGIDIPKTEGYSHESAVAEKIGTRAG
jgi:hypothetical protein